MRKILLGCAISATMALAIPQAKAIPITYTETVTATGSLNGIAFTGALVTISASGDTSTVFGCGNCENLSSATVTIAGGGSDILIARAADFQGASAFAFQHPIIGDILDIKNVAFATYALDTFLGPIAGTGLINPGTIFPTTSGGVGFVLNSLASAVTFLATTGSAPGSSRVPEPTSLALFGGAMAVLGFVRRRK